MRDLYIGFLGCAVVLWALIGNGIVAPAPFATGLFWIYLLLNLFAELWLIYIWKKDRYLHQYKVVKISQRIFDVAVIFYLVNGDLGKLIVIELGFILVESFLFSLTGRRILPFTGDAWDYIDRLDYELMKFLAIAVLLLLFSYNLTIMGEARFMLLVVLLYRKVMTVKRQRLKLKSGCPMDQRSAIVWVFLFIIIAWICILIPENTFDWFRGWV